MSLLFDDVIYKHPFFYGTVITPPEYFKQSILSRALCFETPIASIHYIKQTGFTSRTTAQKMKFSIKNFFSICGQILRKLRLWSHLLKKSLVEKFIFCAVNIWRVLHLFEKSNCSPYLFKVYFFPADIVAVILLEGYCVIQPFFHDEFVDLTRVNAAIYCPWNVLHLHGVVKIYDETFLL